MILSLHIRNYVLIRELDISFRSGFSVITGETGAGKSVMLGALGLLLGQRAESRTTSEKGKTVVEAVFQTSGEGVERFFKDNNLDFDSAQCIVRREITEAGRSRAFINDTPVSLAQLKGLSPYLIDIHSQHQNLLLADRDFQLRALDEAARSGAELSAYVRDYEAWREALSRYRSFSRQVERQRTNSDYLHYQLRELEAADLKEGEQEQLEQEARLLENGEAIRDALGCACELLEVEGESLGGRLHTAHSRLDSVREFLKEVGELGERLESCAIELDDVAEELRRRLEDLGFDPARLDEVNSRLDTIYSLQKKHRLATVKELIDLRAEIREKVDAIDNGDERLAALERATDESRRKLLETAAGLTRQRQTAARRLETEMTERLRELGMPSAKFLVAVARSSEPLPTGLDVVDFLFSANLNVPPRNLAQIASGGEMSRVMLALKSIMSAGMRLTPIVFDEIDSGVSGRVADRMAELMRQMSAGERQIIAITHLPQVAAAGDAHYVVYKSEEGSATQTHVRLLTGEERVMELAHLLSGKELTAAAVENAKELLKQNNR